MKSILLMIPFLYGAIFSYGQSQSSTKNDLEVLKNVLEKYKEIPSLSLEVTATAYTSEKDRQGQVVASGKVKKKKGKYYNQLNKKEIIVNGTEMLVVNHEDKEIAIAKAPDAKTIEEKMQTVSIDSLLKDGVICEYLGKTSGKRKYRINSKDAFISSTLIYIDATDMIDRFVFYYQSLPEVETTIYKLDVQYSNITLTPPPDDIFDLTYYLSKDAKQASVSSNKFKNYTISKTNYSLDDF